MGITGSILAESTEPASAQNWSENRLNQPSVDAGVEFYDLW